MNINVISLFPEIIEASLKGLVGKAFEKKIVELELLDLKEYSHNEYGSVDDAPYGGGEGMVMAIEPLESCLNTIKETGKVIYLSPQGQVFNQTKAIELSKLENITFVCGRYEGVDQRFIDLEVDEEWSIGDYILSGGEVAACVVIDAIARMIPGVLGHEDSNKLESFSDGYLEHPHYTRPEVIEDMEVPEVLLSGNHEEIKKWREKQSISLTNKKRSDLVKKKAFIKAQQKISSVF